MEVSIAQPNAGTYSAMNCIGVWTNNMVALSTHAVTTFLLPA